VTQKDSLFLSVGRKKIFCLEIIAICMGFGARQKIDFARVFRGSGLNYAFQQIRIISWVSDVTIRSNDD